MIDRHEEEYQHYHELEHMPMGADTYAIACLVCKNRNNKYDESTGTYGRQCDECLMEYRSHFEPDFDQLNKLK